MTPHDISDLFQSPLKISPKFTQFFEKAYNFQSVLFCLQCSNLDPKAKWPQKPATHIPCLILSLPQSENSIKTLTNPNCHEKPPNFKPYAFFLTFSQPFTKWPNLQKNMALQSHAWPFPSWTLSQILNPSHTYFVIWPVCPKMTSNSPNFHLSQNCGLVTLCDHLPSTITWY